MSRFENIITYSFVLTPTLVTNWLILSAKLGLYYSAALLQQYFSASEHYFPLIVFPHKHQQKPKFSETNRANRGLSKYVFQ